MKPWLLLRGPPFRGSPFYFLGGRNPLFLLLGRDCSSGVNIQFEDLQHRFVQKLHHSYCSYFCDACVLDFQMQVAKRELQHSQDAQVSCCPHICVDVVHRHVRCSPVEAETPHLVIQKLWNLSSQRGMQDSVLNAAINTGCLQHKHQHAVAQGRAYRISRISHMRT